jgi:hypothetical protein
MSFAEALKSSYWLTITGQRLSVVSETETDYWRLTARRVSGWGRSKQPKYIIKKLTVKIIRDQQEFNVELLISVKQKTI